MCGSLCRPGRGLSHSCFRSSHHCCATSLKIYLSHGLSSGASPGAGVCPHCLPGCLTLGNCVPGEERQVHQPGPEAHRHLGSHGLAASPGQLRGASRAPAGSATGECVGSAHGASPLSGVSADSEWAVSPPGAPSSPPHSVLSLGSSEHLARLILRTGLHSAPVLSSSLVC